MILHKKLYLDNEVQALLGFNKETTPSIHMMWLWSRADHTWILPTGDPGLSITFIYKRATVFDLLREVHAYRVRTDPTYTAIWN